jgi:O-methyltransferase
MAAPLEHRNRDAYIDLLKRSITNYAYLGGDTPFEEFRCVNHYDIEQGQWKIDPLARPLTLLSKLQLDLIEQAVLVLHEENVPGDFLEAGVWRGGAIAFMRALMSAYGIDGRRVFAADSFAGIPKNVRALNDPVDLWRDRWIASLEEMQTNIKRLGLLDDKIVFVPGFFEDTLKTLSSERFALIRLDSDSYESVETSLVHLYPLVSDGGIVIIDDWHLPGCQAAVHDYLAQHGIKADIRPCDGNAYWVKR